MTKNKNKVTSLQKDLMIGLTSSLMFYIISELVGLTDKLFTCFPLRALLLLKIAIAI